MTWLPDLSTLPAAEKDALIRALWEQVETLSQRVTEQEARLGEPPKDSGNSSVPPSRDRKANRLRRPRGLRREASVGRAGGGRALNPAADEVVIARLTSCPHCASAMAEADQELVERYDRIDLPPVKPVVTRVERHGGICQCCGVRIVAPVPQGLEPGLAVRDADHGAGSLTALSPGDQLSATVVIPYSRKTHSLRPAAIETRRGREIVF
jgi:transposase